MRKCQKSLTVEAKVTYYRGKVTYYRGKRDLLGRKRDLLGRKGDLLTQPYLRRARLPNAPQASLSNPVCVLCVCVCGWAREGERGRKITACSLYRISVLGLYLYPKG